MNVYITVALYVSVENNLNVYTTVAFHVLGKERPECVHESVPDYEGEQNAGVELWPRNGCHQSGTR